MVEFRDVVKKYAGTDEALGVPAGTVGGIPVVTPDDLGPAAAMTPAEVVEDPDAQAALSATFAPLAAGIEGSGMPEGVVAAPVGTVYRDLAATNGAVVWVKATGTGSTGWRVLYGDTGWRAITTWDAAGVITGAALASGGPTSGQAGGVWTRRINYSVTVAIRNLTGSDPGHLYDPWPAGFRMGAGSIHDGYGLVSVSSASIGVGLGFVSAPHVLTLYPSNATVGLVKPQWTTSQAWPTTLPGTAA